MAQSQPSQCRIWMGGLEPYMTETFIRNAFLKQGEDALAIKFVRNKSPYCFVSFKSEEVVNRVIQNLNGKIIPNSQPPMRFKLSSPGQTCAENDFPVWIAELNPDVNSQQLSTVFSTKYPTFQSATVMTDRAGFSTGYALLRFGTEVERNKCLAQMNSFRDFGGKPIRMSTLAPKSMRSQFARWEPADIQKYNAYWRSYASWQNNPGYHNFGGYVEPISWHIPQDYQPTNPSASKEDDELELVEHNMPVDVDGLNRELIERDYNFWDALEHSRWLPVEGLDF